MRNALFGLALGLSFAAGGVASAQTYNPVPSGDAQYAQCLATALTRYEGGGQPSKVTGQTKVEAWCTCMWNETPDNFKGSFVSFSETSQGAAMNKTCERYAGWE